MSVFGLCFEIDFSATSAELLEQRVPRPIYKMQGGPGAGPAAGEERDAGVRSLIDVNGLAYRMTPGMSVATSRVTREWDALRQDYSPGQVMSFAISSGAAYVDPDNSYIKFQIRIRSLRARAPTTVSIGAKTGTGARRR